VLSVANLETHYDGGICHVAGRPDDGDIHLFLYHHGNRITGLVILETRGTVWLCRWREDGSRPDCEELLGHDPMWSVIFIWVHSRHRNQGVARLLLLEALKHLGTDLRTVGWYTPFSVSGGAFVKGLCPDEFYIAK